MGQSLAIPRVIPNDWKRLDLIINKIKMRLGRGGSPTFTGLTLSGLTQGSVVFAGASGVISQDNSNLFWDDTINRLGVGVNSGLFPATGMTVSGEMDLIHTATESDDHAFEIDVDAAGRGDVKAIDIDYITGDITKGEDEAVILINIDEIGATGAADVFGLEVLATEGDAGIYGMKVGVVIGPIHQDSGTFENPTIATNDTPSENVPYMKDGLIANTTAIFSSDPNDDDYILIGDIAVFEEIEFIITTGSSGAGIKPKFEYSRAGSHLFTEFFPIDGTNGFRNTGVVAWDADDLTNHGLNTDTTPDTYCIKITRQRTNLTTTPVLGFTKVAATTEYIWDSNGNVNIKTLTISTIAAEDTDVDKFLVDSSGVVKYRTGTEVLADIGGQAQGDVLDDLNTLGANPFTGDPNSDFLIGTSAGTLAWHSGATARTSIGLGITDNVQFAMIGIGITPHAGAPFRCYNDAVGGSISYAGFYNYHRKTAGATDAGDSFTGLINQIIYDDADGVIGFCRGIYSIFQHKQGDIGNGGTRHLTSAYYVTDLDGGKIYGSVVGFQSAIDQEAAHEVEDNVYGAYIQVDLDGTVGGSTYMLYFDEASGIDYGIYQSGTAANVLGGLLTVGGDLDVSGELDVVGSMALGDASTTALAGLYYFKSKNITSAGDNSNRRGISAHFEIGKTGLADYTGVVMAFDAKAEIDDVNTQDWTAAVGLVAYYGTVSTEGSSTGIITGSAGLQLIATFADAVTVTNYYGVKIQTPSVTNNKLINTYAIYINDINTATTLNYAIYTNAGLVRFGGAVEAATTFESTGVATLADGSLLKTNAAPTTDAMIANKKYVDDNVGGAFTSKCRVYLAGTQSIASGNYYKLLLATEDWDTDGEWANNKFTASAAGYYHVSYCVQVTGLGASKLFVGKLYKNGTEYSRGQYGIISSSGGTVAVVGVDDVYLNGSTDYLEIFTYHDHGSNRDYAAGPLFNYIAIHRFA